MVIAGPSPWGDRRASMSRSPAQTGALAVMVSGAGSRGQWASPGCPRAGHQPVFPLAAVPTVRAGQGPRRYPPPRRPSVRPPCGPAGADAAVTSIGAPVPVGGTGGSQDRNRSSQRRRHAGQTAPPPGPRAPGWPGHSRSRSASVAGVGGRAIPSPSARRGLADHPRPVQVVRPAGRSTCTGRERPAPRRVADGDGMTRPGQECAYAPRENHRRASVKARENGVSNDSTGRRNNCRPGNYRYLTR